MNLNTKVLVRITKVDKGYINFQNPSHKLLRTVNVGQLRLVEQFDFTCNPFWIRVKGVMLLVSLDELDYEIIRELPNA